MAGANENSHEGMGVFVSNCGKVSEELGALVIGVHHTGKVEAAGMRGWSGLDGARDAEWVVSSDGTEKTVKVAKLKDGQDGLEWGFALEIIEVGKNKLGKPVTTYVVNLTGDPKPKTDSRASSSKTPRSQIVFELAFGEAMLANGQAYNVGGDPQAQVRAVCIHQIRSAFSKRWVAKPSEGEGEGEEAAEVRKRKRDKAVSSVFARITANMSMDYRTEENGGVEYIWREQPKPLRVVTWPAQTRIPAEKLN